MLIPAKEEMALRGRIGALTLHSRYDSRVATSKARQTFLDRFQEEVDPGGVLSEDERIRRAGFARRAYFTRLALKSAQARRRRATRKDGGGGDD